MVCILYRDMRTYGLHERLYRQAAELGVLFIRHSEEDSPSIRPCENGTIEIVVKDATIGEDIGISVDNLVLAASTGPASSNGKLAETLKTPLNADGFFMEAHVKLRPVEFANEGIFLAGMAHSPKNAEECMTQALAAASRVVALLAQEEMVTGNAPAWVQEEKCSGCGTCRIMCPYDAIKKKDNGKAVVIAASCKGCGACASLCPENTIRMQSYSNDEIMAEIETALGVIHS